jgi:hypothetical protein
MSRRPSDGYTLRVVATKDTRPLFDEFARSLGDPTPPAGLSPAALALWHDGRGDWQRAHEVAQDIDDRMGSRIHAYLHRKEGDIGNAHYWYRRASVEPVTGSLDAEWRTLVEIALR